MNPSTKEKIAKIYELVKRGTTDGEKAAAEIALNKLLKKHNLSEEYLLTIHLTQYEFKYATQLDLDLFVQLHSFFFKEKEFNAKKTAFTRKSIFIDLEYVDWILLSTAYEYFKRHMNSQFKKLCVPLIKKCRSAKTQNKRRKELQKEFFSRYVIKSKIYNQEQVQNVDLSTLSDKARADRERIEGIEGGSYHSQINTGLYLE
ncbi:hypothetical protein [Flavobacterium geliluteum]|uniref:DUF2786 domain-containing protein n=1 Tax=Flavobacterium geliluteum TaxID=2816120 RepID=A0A941B4K4_9FLAO|nr:hypothetical protein [Flavobacterium geliluteum]MBP4139648.1 hypothetical protein [Flavobacterium geliluteum]